MVSRSRQWNASRNAANLETIPTLPSSVYAQRHSNPTWIPLQSCWTIANTKRLYPHDSAPPRITRMSANISHFDVDLARRNFLNNSTWSLLFFYLVVKTFLNMTRHKVVVGFQWTKCFKRFMGEFARCMDEIMVAVSKLKRWPFVGTVKPIGLLNTVRVW